MRGGGGGGESHTVCLINYPLKIHSFVHLFIHSYLLAYTLEKSALVHVFVQLTISREAALKLAETRSLKRRENHRKPLGRGRGKSSRDVPLSLWW